MKPRYFVSITYVYCVMFHGKCTEPKSFVKSKNLNNLNLNRTFKLDSIDVPYSRFFMNQSELVKVGPRDFRLHTVTNLLLFATLTHIFTFDTISSSGSVSLSSKVYLSIAA